MKMKRKAKSGHQKRLESKSKAIRDAATARGQRSLLEMFESGGNSRKTTDDDIRIPGPDGPLTSKLNAEELEDDDDAVILAQATLTTDSKNAKPVPFTSSMSKVNDEWYRGKKLDLNWLLLAEDCLESSREVFGKRKRQVITCLLCGNNESEVRKFNVNGRRPVANEYLLQVEFVLMGKIG